MFYDDIENKDTILPAQKIGGYIKFPEMAYDTITWVTKVLAKIPTPAQMLKWITEENKYQVKWIQGSNSLPDKLANGGIVRQVHNIIQYQHKRIQVDSIQPPTRRDRQVVHNDNEYHTTVLQVIPPLTEIYSATTTSPRTITFAKRSHTRNICNKSLCYGIIHSRRRRSLE